MNRSTRLEVSRLIRPSSSRQTFIQRISHERGTATAIAALWLPLLLLILGLGSDWGRARAWRSRLQSAADAAALAAASRVSATVLVDGRGRVWERTVRLDEPAARAAFEEAVAANLPSDLLRRAGARVVATELALTAADGEVDVRLQLELEAIFLRAAGRPGIVIAARAGARSLAP